MIIQEIELFDIFSEEVEEEVMKIMEPVSYNSGEVIFKEGDPADNFYLLQKGALSLKLPGAEKASFLAMRHGEAVGWSSLAGRDTYSETVECLDPSNLFKINKEKLHDILRRYPSIGLLFYKRLAGIIGERLVHAYQIMGKAQEKRF